MVDVVTIFAEGSTGPNARPARKVMEQVPVFTLGSVLPALMERMRETGFSAADDLATADMPGVDF